MITDSEINEINSFINNILTFMGLKADIKVEQKGEECINVSIDGNNLSHLIGKNGNVLKSFELIINVCFNKGKEKRRRICVDVCNYKKKRETYLKELAVKTADEVIRTKRDIALFPLPPFERKIIHIALLNYKNVTTYSKGDGKNRRVVVTLKK